MSQSIAEEREMAGRIKRFRKRISGKPARDSTRVDEIEEGKHLQTTLYPPYCLFGLLIKG